jgi:ketosteroid isomerase-like protein
VGEAMHIKSLAFVLVMLAGALNPGTVFADSKSTEGSTEMIRKATDEFYIALNQMFVGNISPMEQVWSHGDDVTYTGPTGGIHVGWSNILPIWQEQAKLKLGGKVDAKDLHVVAGSDLALVSNYEVGENTINGETQKVELRATNIFRKEDGHWKMIGHHTDLLPWLVKK